MKAHEVADANNNRLKGVGVKESHPAFLPRLARGPMNEMVVLQTDNGARHPIYENGDVDYGSNVANSKVEYSVVGGVLDAGANKVRPASVRGTPAPLEEVAELAAVA